MNNELTYWLAFFLLKGISRSRKNKIFVEECYNKGKTIIDLYNEIDSLKPYKEGESKKTILTPDEIELIAASRVELPQNAFKVENLLSQGYAIIPFTSTEYPETLKRNLKINAPTILFAKGNLNLLNESSVAIVGSRKADDVSLSFTDNIARKAASENLVVVSGFAKGIDRQALDSVLKYGGKSVIVLPQGIMTFTTGFRQYYKPIIEGRVLVISEFMPEAGWNVGLAMARNTTIYGLANEIYVAQSDAKGGTYEGVKAGLKQERKIYVRQPEQKEKNANALLIEQGAIPVNLEGDLLQKFETNLFNLEMVSEGEEEYNQTKNITERD